MRYQSEIAELSGLGFSYVFADGETVSLFRMILIIPALVMIGLWREHSPMTVHGASILVGYPVLVSKNKTTFANPDGPRIKFFSIFQDGTLLVSGNHFDPTTRGPGIVRNFQAGTIGETWARHQARIQALEGEGRRIGLLSTHEDYAKLQDRDTAAW